MKAVFKCSSMNVTWPNKEPVNLKTYQGKYFKLKSKYKKKKKSEEKCLNSGKFRKAEHHAKNIKRKRENGRYIGSNNGHKYSKIY